MKLKILNGIINIVALQLCSSAFADGLTYHGHAAAEHTTLQLSAAQIKSLRSSRTLLLDSKQRRKMLQETGVDNVKSLFVFPASATTCTCELTNVAVRVKNSVEVPNFLFGRDLASQDVWAWIKRRDEKSAYLKNIQKLKNPSKAIQLFLKAQDLPDNKCKEKISILEEVLKLEPGLKWARRELAGVLVQIGSDEAKLADRLVLYQKAYAIIDQEDTLMKKKIEQDLNRTKARIGAMQ